MPCCSAFGCQNLSSMKNISFHRFPNSKKNAKVYDIWVNNVTKHAAIEFVPTNGSRLCSEHFSSDMFIKSGNRVILKPAAVPTIFRDYKGGETTLCGETTEEFMVNMNECTKVTTEETKVIPVQFKGTFENDGDLVESAMINRDVVNVTSEQGVTIETMTDKEVVSISLGGRKRKRSDDEAIVLENQKTGDVDPQMAHMVGSPLYNCAHDHSYAIKSPGALKRKFNNLSDKVEVLAKKKKATERRAWRLRKKVESLASVVTALKEENLVNEDCANILETTFSGVPREIMKRLLTQKKKKNPGAYPPELRSFALTLKFYSTKAYKYVRETFQLGLPHPSVLRSWYSSIDGEPGFTKDALTGMKAKVLAARKDGQQVVCVLMLDEMSIRKHVEWDGKQFRGFIDLGTGTCTDDSLPEATDALVFMAVSVNSSWKVPVGYFFVDGLTGKEKANLTKTCVEKLHDIGVKVVSITCDGPSSHLSMMKELGAKLSPTDLQPYFQHPCESSAKIYFILDACHMIKLVRNTLSDWKVLKNKAGEMIKWQFLVDLHELQESEGLHLANKLRVAHIHWNSQKMKVNLAAQSFSSSVADALEYCKDKLNLKQFQGCGPTVQFIRIFDRLFDILNSRNPLAKDFKAPIRKSNYQFVRKFLDEARVYIENLKGPNNQPILSSKRKTGFLGFLVSIRSVCCITEAIVCSENPLLKYLLTYKLSQDHLELFFSAVRASGGWNNNPTTRQFISAYKQLLMRHNIKGGHGNCSAQDDTEILNSIQDQCDVGSSSTGISDVAIARRYDLQLRQPAAVDHDYCDVSNAIELSEYKEAAISYIAGYVVKMVEKKKVCVKCKTALTTTKDVIPDLFVTWKTNGGLKLPSLGLLKISRETEKCVIRMLNANGGGLPRRAGVSDAITNTVLPICIESGVFSELDQHMYDSTATDNHIFSLIKCCSKSYITIRMHHLSKQNNARPHDKKIRKQFSKLVLFHHQ